MITQTKLSLLERRANQIQDPAVFDICGGAIEDENGHLYRGYFDEQKVWHKHYIAKEELEYHGRNCKECEYFIILNRVKLPTPNNEN